MKSYEERIEGAQKVITRAVQAMEEGMVDGCLCYLSWENAVTIEHALQNQKRRLERENSHEG